MPAQVIQIAVTPSLTPRAAPALSSRQQVAISACISTLNGMSAAQIVFVIIGGCGCVHAVAAVRTLRCGDRGAGPSRRVGGRDGPLPEGRARSVPWRPASCRIQHRSDQLLPSAMTALSAPVTGAWRDGDPPGSRLFAALPGMRLERGGTLPRVRSPDSGLAADRLETKRCPAKVKTKAACGETPDRSAQNCSRAHATAPTSDPPSYE